MEIFKPQPNPENISKGENELESVENLSVPERVKKLITEKYKFKSLNDFYKLDAKAKDDILKETLFRARSGNYMPVEDGQYANFPWDEMCISLGLEEKELFPDSGFDTVGEDGEHIIPFAKYEDKYKEFFRQQWIRNHSSWFDENKRETNPMARFFHTLVDIGKIKNPKDWFGLSVEDKRKINNEAFGPIDFDKADKWANSIRFGYRLIGLDDHGLKGFLKDKFLRSEKDKTRAEEAIYDKRFIDACFEFFLTTPMSRLPKTSEEEKRFDDLNSPDMNATKAEVWMEGMNVEEDLREGIIKAYEKAEKEKE